MEQTAKSTRKPNAKKLLLIVLAALSVVALALAAVIFGVWHNELKTLGSLRMVRPADPAHDDGAVYEMHVSGGFYLEDFIAGGGASNDAELIDFVTGKLTKGLMKMNISESEIACSSFTAQAQNGDRLFGRNYDFDRTNTCLVFTEGGNGRHATISTVDLQFLGIDKERGVTGLMDKISCLAAPYAPLDGINAAGVSCGIYMSYQGKETVPTDQRTDKPDITSTTMLRLILDYADTVEEAVEIAKAYDLHDSAGTSYHYMVADATGKSAVLEWVYGDDQTDNDGSKRELIVTWNNADAHIGEVEAAADYQCVTNFILRPDYYTAEDDPAGRDRYDRLYAELGKTYGVVADDAAAMDLLAIVGRREWNNDDDNGITVHSAVYNLTQRSMLWVSNENYGAQDATFAFSLK